MILSLLCGDYYIVDNGADFLTVLMPNGWCAAITTDPERPLEKWRRICLGREPTEFGGEYRAFRTLAVGMYEAHAPSKTGKPLVVYFEVTPSDEPEILGTQGDEDLILARLNSLTLDGLYDAREAAKVELEVRGLAPLEEVFKQDN